MWDERYSCETYAYGEEPNSFLVEQWQQHKLDDSKGKVLCLAEGEGRNAVYLAERGHSVTAVDLSKVGLQKCIQLANKRGVSLRSEQADLAHYSPEKNTYNSVIMIFAHAPTQVRRRSLQIAKEALLPGGYLILEGFTKNQIGRGTGDPSSEAMMYTKKELSAFFDPHEILVSREVNRELNEGRFHQGLSATLQFVARKGC